MRSFLVDGRCVISVAAVDNVETPSTNQQPQETKGSTTRALAKATGGL